MNKQQYNTKFEEALQKLNPKQKEAVEKLDGPVMVVAGPGTGKTQLLAARVGNILNTVPDIFPHNILCLTFTDAGAIAMRKRLLSFIGPEAYNVNIFTFHSFCNKVIRENIGYFGGYRNLQSLSDLEGVEVLHEIIDEFPDDHFLKRFKGNVYYERTGLQGLFKTMKQENWTADQIKEEFEKFKAEINDLEEFQYKRKYTDKSGTKFEKGDPNPTKINNELKKYEALLAGIEEFDKYKSKLEEKERFDYADMILWVIEAFKSSPDLLADYQEQYQYLLVDEYQDTNGAQNTIIDQLVSYWGDDANIFVVGDDDQSIYRFQGASMDNIVEYKEQYDPEVIILENNYRSSQQILDRSKQLIEHNTKRLVQLYPIYQKELIESRTEGLVKVDPVIVAYPNAQQEAKDIADQIMALRENGTALKDIAVIYKMHKNAELLISYLTRKGVPLALKKKVNVLHEQLIRQLIMILEYVELEIQEADSGEGHLYQLLHYSWFNLKPYDLGKIAVYCSRKTKDKKDDFKWREVIQSEEHLKAAGLTDIEKILEVSGLIERWMTDVHNLTLQMFFEKILTDSGVFKTIMDTNKPAWNLQLVNTFFELIKAESVKSPTITLQDFLGVLENMRQAELILPLMKIMHAEQGVQFLTAHSSKGLEFKHVFIISADDKNWVTNNYRGKQFKFPPSLVPSSDKSDVDDDRRLFYVAMTRCESFLHMSYYNFKENEKETEPCRFLSELIEGSNLEVQEKVLPDSAVNEFTQTLIGYHKEDAVLFDHDHIDKFLNDYSVSVTHLNKYLRCPLSFYFENVLRVPSGRSKSMGFGNAVHKALEQYFIDIQNSPERTIPEAKQLIKYFENGLYGYRSHFTEKEFKDLIVYGNKILQGYFDEYHMRWSLPREYKQEHKIRLVNYKDIPINGLIDSIHVYDDKLEVFDYKTGKYNYAVPNLKRPKDDEDPGGDYWRQIVFYKLLLIADPKITTTMVAGTMDFIEPYKDEYKQKRIEVTNDDIKVVEEQLKTVYQGIQKHEFDGCQEEDCHWCQFVKEQYKVDTTLKAYEDDADESQTYEDIGAEIVDLG